MKNYTISLTLVLNYQLEAINKEDAIKTAKSLAKLETGFDENCFENNIYCEEE
jgi:hypothetical protein